MADEKISREECELRCGLYKAEVADIRSLIATLQSEVSRLDRWRAGHDGRIGVYWEQQFTLNKSLERRMTAIERKVLWSSGFAAGVGAVLGTALARFFG